MFKKLISHFVLILFTVNINAQSNTRSDDDDDTIPVRHVNRVISTKVDTEFDKNKDNGEGPYKEFHSNKKLSYEGTYKNYKEVGLWKRYYETGVLSSKEYHNANGDMDSIFGYNEKGKIVSEARWKNSKKSGIWREYSSDGVIQKLQTFKDNQLNGKTISYDNGKIYIESNYKEGSLDGIWKEYNDDGTVTKTKKYINGDEQD